MKNVKVLKKEAMYGTDYMFRVKFEAKGKVFEWWLNYGNLAETNKEIEDRHLTYLMFETDLLMAGVGRTTKYSLNGSGSYNKAAMRWLEHVRKCLDEAEEC